MTVDYSDSYSIPLVEECKTCTAPANLRSGDGLNIADLKAILAEVGVTVDILSADELAAGLADGS